MKGLTQKNYQDHILCSFAYKLVCVDVKFSKPIFFLDVELLLLNLLEYFLTSIGIVKKVTEKHFNKILIMTEEEEQF